MTPTRCVQSPPAKRSGWCRQVRRLLASLELVARTITALRRENSTAEHPALKEGEVVEALGALEPIWDELYPAEQTRILRLLIERMKSRLTASQ